MTAVALQLPEAWPVSLFESVKSNRPVGRGYDFLTLIQLLTDFRDRGTEKGTIPLWSPASYPRGATRAKAAVLSVSCLVFDVDDGTHYMAARDALGGWGHIGHTSWSHTDAHHKFRVVLPLRAPVPGDEWDDAWRAAMGLWQAVMPVGSTPDTKCSDASRCFFLPAYRAEQPMIAWVNPGPLLSLGRAKPPPAPRRWVPQVHQGGADSNGEAQQRREKYRRPEERAALGATLGGAVSEEWVRKVLCPDCGRPSLGWALDPGRLYQAMCGHKNSCNARFYLDELALMTGVEAA